MECMTSSLKKQMSVKMKMFVCMFIQIIALMVMGGVLCEDQDFHCDFKSKSWCGITQSKDDDFDWTLRRGRTPTKGTGPDKAHTNKYYVFIESSKPRRAGHKAAFVLPHPKSSGKYSLEFHYVMNGKHVRKLSVLKGTQEVWSNDKDSKSTSWVEAKVSMTLRKDDTIKFVAERGRGFRGDIAVDDITLKKVGSVANSERNPTTTRKPKSAKKKNNQRPVNGGAERFATQPTSKTTISVPYVIVRTTPSVFGSFADLNDDKSVREKNDPTRNVAEWH